MSRLATPPAQVPTLTDVVHALAPPNPPQPASILVIALPQGLQKEIVSRALQGVGKDLKARLRQVSKQQPGGFTRTQLVAFLCHGAEQAVGDAVNQALSRHVQRAGVAPTKG